MSNEPKKEPTDVVSLGETLPSGETPFVRTRQVETELVIETGTARLYDPDDLSESETYGDKEHFRLRHIADNQFEVLEVIRSGGPPKVNSIGYKNGWDRIFGHKDDKYNVN